ncbi:MAG TPA: Uma2 family endonuclease [Pirellulales bacterium]|nr:Uma2 family endonuclease [Pirellulales bacterium]
MATAGAGAAPFPSSCESVPPLEMGDHLTRAEFERRYNAMPGLKKAELVEGVVYMPSPVKPPHGRPHLLLAAWLGYYLSQTPGLDAADNATVRFDDVNEPQPDLLLAIEPAAGGKLHVDEDGYYAGSPEFIAEVAASSVSYDLHAKLRVYEREGVREYLVWRTRDGELDWFRLEQGKYVPMVPDDAGIVKSTVFPGLWLDRAALLRRDLPRVFAVLQEGIASPGHASFVEELAERGRQ